MRVSYQWLRDYVNFDMPADELAHRLTMVGLEVEEVNDRYGYLETVVAARVTAVEDHPRGHQLKVCTVDAGGGFCQVVCGAPNVVAGMMSALALVGTELPGGREVGAAEIRGVPSEGMLCSEAELIVGPDASGIMSLDASVEPGAPLKKVLGLEDWVFEIGITPNRPDCLSILGVARETAALTGGRVKYPEVRVTESADRIEDVTSVTIQAPDHCPRYTARVIRNVTVGPSPFWLVDKLAGAGIRSINNIVDITNFVMMETGQPLHAFDLDRLEEQRIVVDTAAQGDVFITLDGAERPLGPEMLMIRDGKKAVGLAGVMGGLNSEIEEDTANVLLESAYFSPVSIRKTSKTLGLSTEASFRFERGNDPDLCPMANDRAAALMAELGGGEVLRGLLDEYPLRQHPVTLPLSPARCNAFLGTTLTAEKMAELLKNIELGVTVNGEDLSVAVPMFRVDLIREVDLYEEVARLVGYDSIPATLPAVRTEGEPIDQSLVVRSEARRILEGMGLSEAVNYSFIADGFCDRLGLPADDERRRTVRIINPLSEDQALMRTTLAPGLLDTLRRNQSHQVGDVALYEIGMSYFHRPDRELPDERLSASGLLSGMRAPKSLHGKTPEPMDFWDIKGVVEELLDGLNIDDASFESPAGASYYDPNASARVTAGGRALGLLGRLDREVTRAFDIREDWGNGDVLVFELDLEEVMAARRPTRSFTTLPRFPSVSRDMTILVGREVEAARVSAFMMSLGEDLLTDITVFDVFQDEQKVGAERKSLSFSLLYRAPDRTLVAEEINAVHERIAARVSESFAASFQE